MTMDMSSLIKNHIEQRKQTKLDDIDKKINAKNGVLKQEFAKLKQQEQTIIEEFDIATWLTNAAARAKQISMATHAIKFTHGSAKGSNILALESNNTMSQYLDSSTLTSPAVDAVGNAAALDVAKLLQLDDGTATLATYLLQNNHEALRVFATSDDQCQCWAEGFRQALSVKAPSSHTLAKQIYFPLGNGEYHLISPLYSSALAHELFHIVQHSRFSDEMKAARDARKNQRPSEVDVVRYPDLAVTISGGSKPQNISQLNSQRYGKTYLFSCAAPNWQSQYKPPMYGVNWFDSREVNNQCYKQIKMLADFLIKVKALDSNLRIRRYRDRLVDQILDIIIANAATHQAQLSSWSQHSELSHAQQCWLDPKAEHHSDIAWQQEVSRDFGLWLNHRLEKASQNQLMLGSEALNYWQSLCEQALFEVTA